MTLPLPLPLTLTLPLPLPLPLAPALPQVTELEQIDSRQPVLSILASISMLLRPVKAS